MPRVRPLVGARLGRTLIGLTCNNFDATTGQLYDSDIAIDSHDEPLTAASDSDLDSVLLHEVGHFLGLAHVSDPKNIMYPFYTGIVRLDEDNQSAICAIYPPGRMGTGPCSYLPRHGFSPECAGEQTKLTCSASPAAATPGSSAAWLGALLAALTLRRAALRRARSRGGRGANAPPAPAPCQGVAVSRPGAPLAFAAVHGEVEPLQETLPNACLVNGLDHVFVRIFSRSQGVAVGPEREFGAVGGIIASSLLKTSWDRSRDPAPGN